MRPRVAVAHAREHPLGYSRLPCFLSSLPKRRMGKTSICLPMRLASKAVTLILPSQSRQQAIRALRGLCKTATSIGYGTVGC